MNRQDLAFLGHVARAARNVIVALALLLLWANGEPVYLDDWPADQPGPLVQMLDEPGFNQSQGGTS